MAIRTVAANDQELGIMIAYNTGNTIVSFYDEPVYAWLIDDATNLVTPVMPGSWPTRPTDTTNSPPYVMIDINTGRATAPGVLAPMSFSTMFSQLRNGPSGARRLQSFFLLPVLQDAFANWALANPGNV